MGVCVDVSAWVCVCCRVDEWVSFNLSKSVVFVCSYDNLGQMSGSVFTQTSFTVEIEFVKYTNLPCIARSDLLGHQ
jgi:hypothetical protein